MKTISLLGLFLLFFSCNTENKQYHVVVINEEGINANFPQEIDQAGQVLLEGYLYAYGNECYAASKKNKCKILPLLNVENECNKSHLNHLLSWFENDPIMCSKLQNCPALPVNFAIDNSIDKVILKRHADTLAIEYHIKGLNNSQEKSWNIEKTDKFLVQKNHFVKLK